MKRARLLPFLALFTASVSASAGWPDVKGRIDRGLSSDDPVTRRLSAERLLELGAGSATELILRAMKDEDIVVRVSGARAAVETHLAAAADLVHPWLSDREVRLRRQACEVLGAFPSARAIPVLARALGDPDASVRLAAAAALGAQGSTEAVSPLIGKLEDSEPSVRARVADALARLHDPRAIVPLVGKAQDSVVEVRLAIIRALGSLGDPKATQALLLSLRDSSNDVRLAAIEALGSLRVSEASVALVPFLSERGAPLRRGAVDALGQIGTDAAIASLVALLGTGEDATAGINSSPVRSALLSVGSRAADAVLPLLSSPTRATSASAAWILGELREPRAIPLLVRGLRAGTIPEDAALRALGRIHDASVLPVVLESLRAKESREAALRATEDLLDPEVPDGRAVDPLADLLARGEPTGDERLSILRLLGKTGSPRALETLSNFVLKANEERRTALRAISRLSMPAGASAPKPIEEKLLVLLRESKTTEESLDVALAIGAVGGDESRSTLLRALKEGATVDRAAAFEALTHLLERKASERDLEALASLAKDVGSRERSALYLALGRAAGATHHPQIDELRTSAVDRRLLAGIYSLRPQNDLEKLRRLLDDKDDSVRAEASWFIGEVGDATDVPKLAAAAKSSDIFVSIDAVGALSRLATILSGPTADGLRAPLCEALGAAHPFARANALVGLRKLGRCGDGSKERALLDHDESAFVRLRAAELLVATRTGADDSYLARCRNRESAPNVADVCARASGRAPSTHAVSPTTRAVVYVVPPGKNEPAPSTPYVAELEGGLVRAGRCDLRGAFFEPRLPSGTLVIHPTFGE